MEYQHKVNTYIRKYIPYYRYKMNDFMVSDINSVISITYWNPLFNVPIPTEQDLDEITQEEYNNNKKFDLIINCPGIKINSNIGSQDTNITVLQLMGQLITGNPSGSRIWKLPSSSDIIMFFRGDVFVEKTFSVTFINISVTKGIKIEMGQGMTLFGNSNNILINNISPIVNLLFKIDNITPRNEAIIVYKC